MFVVHTAITSKLLIISDTKKKLSATAFADLAIWQTLMSYLTGYCTFQQLIMPYQVNYN